jgi:hypothetical protein
LITVKIEGSRSGKGAIGDGDARDCTGVDEDVVPHVFISYASENIGLARRIAEACQLRGIEVWWDKWCIYPGDSLRQKDR